MKDDSLADIKQSIRQLQATMKMQLALIESEIQHIINSSSTDKNLIGHLLDTLLSFIDFGLGRNIFLRLLEYYKTIDAEGALFYWNEYNQQNEE